MLKKIIISNIAMLMASSAMAVSLDEALSSGYEAHEDFKIARTDFLNSVEDFPRALANFMPKISAGVEYVTKDTKRHRDGADSQSDHKKSHGESYSREITVEQSLFDGFGSIAALKSAQSSFRAARANFYANEQNIMLKAIETYLNCVEAAERYNIATISVNTNKTQLTAIQEKFALGEATKTEVASTRQAMASAEAQQAAALSNYESAKSEFTRVFGIEPKDLAMPSVPQDIVKSQEELRKMVASINPMLESAKHKLKSSASDEYKAKAELLPKVNLRVRGDHTYPKNLPTNGRNTDNTYNLTSTLSVNVPILAKGGTEYSEIRKAKNQKRKAAIELDSTAKQLQSQSQSMWLGLKASTTRSQAATAAVKAAEVAYEGMVQEESLGSKTIIDVLMAQERLNKAREEEVSAKKDLLLMSYRMKSLTGHLTAKALKLKVKYFEPEKEFKKLKSMVIGF